MLDRIRSKLSFANTISLIALFVALGGTGYAAMELPRNSVGKAEVKKRAIGASEIRRNAVKASELRRNGVGRSEIRTGGVSGDEVADRSLTAADFPTGVVANLDADLLDGKHAADFLLSTAKAADADKLDGLEPGAIGRERFANVDTNGAAQPTLGNSNGATEAIRVNAGNYRVDFGDFNLAACSYQATSGEFNENQGVQVEPDATDPTRLAVSVHDSDAGTNVDGDFNVAVLC